MKQNKKVLFLTQAAAIAALYVVLTHLSNALGLASGAIQVRISEVLTILPFFTPAAIPGLYVGCLLSNLTCGCAPWDIVFGSLATLLGALGTYAIRKKLPDWCACIPPILANTLIVPFVIYYVYPLEPVSLFGKEVAPTIPIFMVTVCIGEVIACGIFGMIFLKALKRNRKALFQA